MEPAANLASEETKIASSIALGIPKVRNRLNDLNGLNDLNLRYAQIAQAGNVVEPGYSVSGTPGSLVFLS